jgi:Protein of unknown function (DUF3300)
MQVVDLTSLDMKVWSKIAVVCLMTGAALSLPAQVAVPPPMPVYQPLGDAELDQLLGPIALYPDPLVAQILPASTLPTQIVLADRYVSDGGDPNQVYQQSWDASVQALVHYPEVLKWLDDNLDWTTEVGQAFLNQQQAVMESIQRLRQSAVNFGNLQSTPQQQVVNDGGDIEIVPADPEVIYVPVYQPAQVYYQTCYGPPFVSFGAGFAVGYWLNCDFDWHNHNIIVWNRAHPRPPNWWHEPPRQRDFNHAGVWHPNYRAGVVVVNRGDRGWGVLHNQPQPVVATVGRSVSESAAPRQTPRPAARPPESAIRSEPIAHPTQAPAGHYAPINRPTSTGAFIGIQSSQATRTYSNRGQQSMNTAPQVPHAAPASPPASRPAAPSSGHDSNPAKH